MEERKKEELAQLYALRAGLSAVASENDETQKIKNTAETAIADCEKRQEANTAARQQLSDKLNDLQKSYTNTRETLSAGKQSKGTLAKKVTVRFTLALLVLAAVVVALFFLIRYFVHDITTEGGGFFAWVFFILITGAVGIGGLVLVIFIIKWGVEAIQDARRDYFLTNSSYDHAQNAVLQLPQQISEIQSQIAACNKKAYEITAQIKQQHADRETALAPHYATGSAVYTALQQQYGTLLDERDWGDVDLVIFAYETGRADTVKEALAFVDGERRTNRIVNAISEATTRLNATIETGFRGLAVNMVKCFKAISDQINENAKAQFAQNQAMLARVDYANALQAQRNVPSQKLAEENQVFLSQARAYMDQATVQMRNNGGRI